MGADMPNRIIWVAMASAIMLLAAVSSGGAATVTVHQPGYSYAPFVSTSVYPAADIELDASGNIYLCNPGNSDRITPGASVSSWSSAPIADIVFAPGGDGYAAGGGICDCITSVSANGAFSTLHADSHEWSYVTLATDGTLLANTFAGASQGLYSIDRTTGSPTLLVAGGPGPGGSGFYASMLIGMDGKLYTNGSNGLVHGLFRLDSGQFTQIATWPHGCFGLAQDNQGIFYTSVPITPLFGTTVTHEVWMYDPNVGTPALLADGPGTSVAVAYDRARNLLYVQNDGDVYILGKSATPTRRETWSAVKAKFR
jgi:hypothetical protein